VRDVDVGQGNRRVLVVRKYILSLPSPPSLVRSQRSCALQHSHPLSPPSNVTQAIHSTPPSQRNKPPAIPPTPSRVIAIPHLPFPSSPTTSKRSESSNFDGQASCRDCLLLWPSLEFNNVRYPGDKLVLSPNHSVACCHAYPSISAIPRPSPSFVFDCKSSLSPFQRSLSNGPRSTEVVPAVLDLSPIDSKSPIHTIVHQCHPIIPKPRGRVRTNDFVSVSPYCCSRHHESLLSPIGSLDLGLVSRLSCSVVHTPMVGIG